MRVTSTTYPPHPRSKSKEPPKPSKKTFRIKVKHAGKHFNIPIKKYSTLDKEVHSGGANEYLREIEGKIRRKLKLPAVQRILSFERDDAVGEEDPMTGSIVVNLGKSQYTLRELIEDPEGYGLMSRDPDVNEIKGNNNVAGGVVSDGTFTLVLSEVITTPAAASPSTGALSAVAEVALPLLVVLVGAAMVTLNLEVATSLVANATAWFGSAAQAWVWWIGGVLWAIWTPIFSWGYFGRLSLHKRNDSLVAKLAATAAWLGGLLCTSGFAHAVLNRWMGGCAVAAIALSLLENRAVKPERKDLALWCRILVVLVLCAGLMPAGRQFASSSMGGDCTSVLNADQGRKAGGSAATLKATYTGEPGAVLEALATFAERLDGPTAPPAAAMLYLGTTSALSRQLSSTVRAFAKGALGKCPKTGPLSRILTLQAGSTRDTSLNDIALHLGKHSADLRGQAVLVLVAYADAADWIPKLLAENIPGRVGFVFTDATLREDECGAAGLKRRMEQMGAGGFDLSAVMCTQGQLL